MNSVGILPLDYLDETPTYLSKSLLINAKQLLKQFILKEEYKISTEVLLQKYKQLHEYSDTVAKIQKLIDNYEYSVAINQTNKFMKVILAGIDYYHTFDLRLTL